jgi:imidazolonepropionase-like amidohydrolase
MNKLTILFSLIFVLNSFSQTDYLGEGPYSQLIIRGVTLINGDGSPPRGPIDITVENNKIVAIDVVGYDGIAIKDEDRPKLKAGGHELDANGMYLLPGFIDMHGHIGGRAQGAEPEYVFKLWMAHGVTTVREPSGRGIDFALDLKHKSERHEIVAPRIFAYTAFGQISGSFNPLNDSPITTAEQARIWVRANAKNGADGIKFFGAEPDIMAAAIDEK